MSETCNTRVWDALEPLVDGVIPPAVGEYIEAQSYEHQDALASSFAQLRARSTPAFLANIGAVVGAAMPTSFQEAGHVGHALNQYVGQQVNYGPHRLVGYLNWPDYLPRNAARETRAQIELFMAKNPNVPYGYFEDAEAAPITIGGIRKLVTDSLMAISGENALLTGHDADQRWLNPTHLNDLLDGYRSGCTYPPAGVLPELTHSRLPAHLSNMDMLIQWFEDPGQLTLTDTYFEPGPAFGAPEYRGVKGYSADLTLAETHDLIKRINYSKDVEAHGMVRVPHAKLVMSPRRLVEKLDKYSRMAQFWSGSEDFGAPHDYRTSDESYADVTDLPDAIRDLRLREYGGVILQQVRLVAEEDRLAADPHAYALEECEKIRQRLGGPENMFQ